MLKRSISTFTLLFVSVSAILGSGWLFSAYYTSILAGPSALLSWLIGGIALGFIAFTFAELSAMIPITGSSSRIPQYTHGTVVSFLFAWITWLSYSVLAAVEVQATLQYLSYYFPRLIHLNGSLTAIGYGMAGVLMMLVSTINIVSLRWLLRCNNILTVLKLCIPLMISGALLIPFFYRHFVAQGSHTHAQHFAFLSHGFFPMGAHGLFAAMTSGIAFAFNGFKQACEMAGEARNPKKSLPIAVIGSIAMCLLIYMSLQMAFLTSITRSMLQHGWAGIYLVGSNSPFATILSHHHLPVLITFLYLGALISPFAASLMYMGSAGRSLYAMSKNDYLPTFFQRLTTQGNPFVAILITFVLGMFAFAPLPGWNQMARFITSLIAVTYVVGPICLLSLRRQAPDQPRPFKLPTVRFWSGLAFYMCTLLIYWSGWEMVSKLGVSLVAGFLVLLAYHFFTARGRQLTFHWRSAIWLWPYFIGITVISYCGNFGHGHAWLPSGTDFIVIALLCTLSMWLSQRYQLAPEQTKLCLDRLKLS